MNDALDHGARMRSETVTMSRDEYEVAIRVAREDERRLILDEYRTTPHDIPSIIAQHRNLAWLVEQSKIISRSDEGGQR